MPYGVNGRIPFSDFEDPTDDMIRNYVKSKWSIINPGKSTNPPADYSTKVRFADFDYDYFSTYHVMVIQDEQTNFDNEFLGVGMLGFMDPVLLEISARRLTYGKNFEQIDNIKNEIVRILEQFEPDDISGVQAINVTDPGDINPESQFINRLPRTIWKAQVKCIVYYYKNFY